MSLSASEILSLNDAGVDWGACYNYTEDSDSRTPDCKVKLKTNCYGLFEPKTDCVSGYVDSYIKNIQGNWQSIGVSGSVFSSFKPGDIVWNSIYAGTYIPSGISLSDGLNIYSSSDSSQYAILIYPTIVPCILSENTSLSSKTSAFSGQYNRNEGNKFNAKINLPEISDNTNIFLDWVILSYGELEFLHNKYLQHLSLRTKINSMLVNKNHIVTSSTVFTTKISRHPNAKDLTSNYLYGMGFPDGKISLVNPTFESNFILARSIPIIPTS